MSSTDSHGNNGSVAIRGQLSIAVAMATYNGARFVEEQMESIRQQSLPANRVIIRDDGSTDGTQAVVRDYILKNHLTNWDFAENESNKGFTSNFLDAALESSENVIFFSDQDDIWLEEKIVHAMDMFIEHEDCIAVLCNSSVVDELGKKADTVQTKRRRITSRIGKVDIRAQVSSMVASGHTLSVRRDFLVEVAPIIKAHGLTYDSPIGIIAAAYGGLYKTDTTDVLHRVHAANASSPKYGIWQRMASKSSHIAGRKFQLDVLEKCRGQLLTHCDERTLAMYDREIAARRRSLSALESGQITPLIAGLFRRSPMKNNTIEVANLAIGLFGRG